MRGTKVHTASCLLNARSWQASSALRLNCGTRDGDAGCFELPRYYRQLSYRQSDNALRREREAAIRQHFGKDTNRKNHMKITFRGWGREVYTHEKEAVPVYKDGPSGRFTAGKTGEPVKWDSDTTVYFKLRALGLTGDFLVQVEANESELRSWFKKYVKSHPEDALRFISEMQSEAIVEMIRLSRHEVVDALSAGR